MGELTETRELTFEHREMLLKYGYPFARLEASLVRWPEGQATRRVRYQTDANTWNTPSKPATVTQTSCGESRMIVPSGLGPGCALLAAAGRVFASRLSLQRPADSLSLSNLSGQSADGKSSTPTAAERWVLRTWNLEQASGTCALLTAPTHPAPQAGILLPHDLASRL